MQDKRRVALGALPYLLLPTLLAGCAAGPPRPPAEVISPVLGQNAHYAVVLAGQGETLSSLAERFLGDRSQAWRIADANNPEALTRGQEVVIPLIPTNSVGVYSDGHQIVPILVYHRFSEKGRNLMVSPRQFDEQMAYLRDNGYRVIPLTRLLAFLRGELAVPQKAVAITIDDGFRSTYEVAFPILKRYGFPATVFVYTDYVGRGGLTWAQAREMKRSGLISIEPHSKTHKNLTVKEKDESDEDYRVRIWGEIGVPKAELERHLGTVTHSFAYPFGATNTRIIEEVKAHGFEAAFSVKRGGNPFFAYPYALRRTLIYGHEDIAEFKKALEVFEPTGLR